MKIKSIEIEREVIECGVDKNGWVISKVGNEIKLTVIFTRESTKKDS